MAVMTVTAAMVAAAEAQAATAAETTEECR